MTSERPQTTSRLAAVGLLLTLAGLSGAALGLDVCREGRVSSDDAISRATGIVRAGFRPGDGVVVRPFWDKSPWIQLADMGEGTDAFPFPALLTSDRPDPMALLGFDRLWVVGLHGVAPAAPDAVADVASETAREPVDERTAVAVYEVPRLQPLKTLTADFDHLVVSRRDPDGNVIACPRRLKRYQCRLDAWFDLHTQRHDVFHQMVDWVYAHPGPGATTLVVEWPDLPRGASIVLRAGWTLGAVRNPEGAPTRVVMSIDDVVVADQTLAPRVYSLMRAAAPIPMGAEAGGGATMRLEISTPEHGWRELMVQADVIEAVPAPVQRWIDEQD